MYVPCCYLLFNEWESLRDKGWQKQQLVGRYYYISEISWKNNNMEEYVVAVRSIPEDAM